MRKVIIPMITRLQEAFRIVTDWKYNYNSIYLIATYPFSTGI